MRNYILGIVTCLIIANTLMFAYMLGCFQSGRALYVVSVPADNQLIVTDNATAQAYEATMRDSFPYQAKKGR